MSGKTASYRVDTAALDQHQAIVEIWQQGLAGNSRMGAKFEWFYRNSPIGMPVICVLRELPGGTPVGTASAGQRRMLWCGREIRAGLLVDFAVVPAHRSAGPALMLARAMVEHGRQHFHFLYGFPNSRAAAITRRAGHQHVADMRRYVRVLRHGPYLRRKGIHELLARSLGWCLDCSADNIRRIRQLRPRTLRWQWVDHADPRFDALWQASDHGDGLLQIRDAAMARWRFDQCPLADTRYLLATDRATGELHAWFAVTVENDMFKVLDYWSTDALTGLTVTFVDGLLTVARNLGHVSVSFEYAGPASRLRGWRRAGFVARDQRPIFASLNGPGNVDESALHFTAADEDQ